MAGVWKARVEWVDDQCLESDEDSIMSMNGNHPAEKADSTLPHQRARADKPTAEHKKTKTKRRTEKLIIGWGDAAWVVHVSPGGPAPGKDVGERLVGSAEIIHLCVLFAIS
jgi:hypothetical protein